MARRIERRRKRGQARRCLFRENRFFASSIAFSLPGYGFRIPCPGHSVKLTFG
jgi:hypothetical protein